MVPIKYFTVIIVLESHLCEEGALNVNELTLLMTLPTLTIEKKLKFDENCERVRRMSNYQII